MLSLDEGDRDRPYDDKTQLRVRAPVGNITIGRGRNLDAKPLSRAAIEFLFDEDLNDALQIAVDFVGIGCWERLTENRQLALLNLAFNIGNRLRTFQKMLAAIKAEDYPIAGLELRRSLWALQVDPKERPGIGRDDRVINLLEKDRYDY